MKGKGIYLLIAIVMMIPVALSYYQISGQTYRDEIIHYTENGAALWYEYVDAPWPIMALLLPIGIYAIIMLIMLGAFSEKTDPWIRLLNKLMDTPIIFGRFIK